jgi:hypothetical protein
MLSKLERQATKDFGQLHVVNNNKGELEIQVPESVADPQNLSIEVKNGMLCVSAKKSSDGYSSQFTYRTTLPENVETENIQAHWDNKTKALKFILPTKPQEEQKLIQIPVKISQGQEQTASESKQEMEVETTQESEHQENETETKTEQQA